MQSLRNIFCGLFFVALAVAGFAQSSEMQQPAAPQAAATPQTPAATGEPALSQPLSTHAKRMRAERGPQCWRLAGITPDMMNQRWKINDEAQVKVSQVCADPTLSPEKRQDKIHEIDEQRDKEIAHLIPAKELESYRSCQAKRDAERPANPDEKKLGPCGGVIPASAAHDSHDAHDHHAGSPSPTK
jgi:hypothetical protein